MGDEVPEHDESADDLAGEVVSPEHTLDIFAFDREGDGGEVDAP